MNSISTLNKTILFSSIIFCLVPLTYITGPFLSDLSIVFVVIIGTIYFIKKRLINEILKSKILLLSFAVYFYFLFTSLISNNILLSLESSLFYFRFFLFGIFTALIILINKKMIINLLFYTLTIAFTILLLSAIYELIFNSSIFDVCNSYVKHSKPQDRISSLFCRHLILGAYIVKLVPLYIYVLYEKFFESKGFNNLVCLLLIIFCFFVFFTGERTAFFLSLLQLFLITFILNKKIIPLFIFLLAIFLLGILNIDNKKISVYKIRMVDSITEIIDIKNNSFTFFTKGHEEIYISSFELYKKSPIFGIGPKVFRHDCVKHIFTCSTHPHNYYLQMLTETGLIGFFILFFLFIFVTFNLFKKVINITFHNIKISSDVFILILFFINFFPLVPTSSIFNNYNSVILFFGSGFLINMYKEKLFSKKLISNLK